MTLIFLSRMLGLARSMVRMVRMRVRSGLEIIVRGVSPHN